MDEKIGPVGEKTCGQKIDAKNSGWKMDGKNWSKR